jgi:hypothetical protein
MKSTLKKIMAMMIAGLMLIVAAPLKANAETGNNFEYKVSNGQATIVGCNYINGKVTIPDTLSGYPVTRLEKDLFFGECDEPELTSITIPASVTSIPDNLFESCGILESINVDAGNPAYASEKGVLFNKSKTELIQYPQGKKGSSFTIPNSVTNIGDGAFNGCYDLETITIPDSITSIGAGAFDGTSWYNGHKGLIYAGKMVYGYKEETPVNKAIVLKPGTIGIVTGAFAGCDGVASITVPASVTNLADGAFESCHAQRVFINEENPALTIEDGVLFNKSKTDLIQYIAGRKGSSYTIQANVTRIRDKAFSGCDGLKSITIPDSVKSIGDEAFSGCDGLTSITIPANIKSIGVEAFFYCTGLKSITISDSVKSIGDEAFSNCRGLKSITIPASVKSIGDEAFSDCYALKSITIPASVKSIGDEAFSGCQSLTSITIPNGVESIGDSAFGNCWGLTNITIPDSVVSIEDRAFYETPWLDNQPDGLIYAGKVAYRYKGYMPNDTVIVLKHGTKSIAGGAFLPEGNVNENPGLFGVSIPNTVTNIGSRAFSGCINLNNVTIPKSVVSIGDQAFVGCTGLKSVTIPKSVVSIGEQAFGFDDYGFYEGKITDFTINCFANSAGQRYAKENRFTYNILPASAAARDPAVTAGNSGMGNRITVTAVIFLTMLVFLALAVTAVFIITKKKKKNKMT